MLVADPEFLERARVVSLHGMSRNAFNRYDKGGSWFYEVTMPGFKYNMTDIQAALGLVQLAKLERMQARRREIVNQYHAAFKDVTALEIPVERPEVEHAWHLYVLRLNLDVLSIDRNRFISELSERNIGSSVHFIPLHLHPFYRDKYGFKPEDFPVAFSNYQRIVSIPLSPKLTDADVADVIEAVLDIVKQFQR
jgi:dTDP-4-amino-4,6-dideoxygalactose transaminase